MVCDAYNILVATPNAVKSESYMVLNLAYNLAEAGHQVTFISSYKSSKKHENLTTIWLPEVQEIHDNLELDSSIEESLFALYKLVEFYSKEQNQKIWENLEVLDVWKNRNKFHLLLTMSYYSEGIFPFLMDNDIPLVQVISMGHEHLALSYQGNWLTPAVLPSMLTEFCEEMNFWERTTNLLSTIQFYYFQLNAIPKYTEPVAKRFPNIGPFYRQVHFCYIITIVSKFYHMSFPRSHTSSRSKKKQKQ